MNDLQALYLHIPFCERHCPYCDFNVHIEQAQSRRVEETVAAIQKDIEQTAQRLRQMNGFPARITTVFWGGGTPTFLSASQISSLATTLRDVFPITNDAEISCEANPGSSDSERFDALQRAGFNRLSIGVQSFDDQLLRRLDRTHTAEEARQAIGKARQAGFANLSLDLMFGLPEQTVAIWEASLEMALEQEPEHLSMYGLTLEAGTRFERLHKGGKLSLPGEDLQVRMYERAIERAADAGFEHYEVSNFAKSGYQCQHNMVYWQNLPYLGFGPGAVSYLNRRRWKKERLPARYIRKVAAEEDLSEEEETLEIEQSLGETMMVALRMRRGVSIVELERRFGIRLHTMYAEPLEKLQQQGLVEVTEDHIRLTHHGLLIANHVAAEFLV